MIKPFIIFIGILLLSICFIFNLPITIKFIGIAWILIGIISLFFGDKTKDKNREDGFPNLEERQPFDVDQFVKGLGIDASKLPPQLLSASGEIISESAEGQEEISIDDFGNKYFRENGKEYFSLNGKNMELGRSHPKVETINEFINCLIDKKIFNLRKIDSKDLVIRETQIPEFQQVGETHEYCGYHSEMNNNQRMILLDNRLPEPAKLTVAFHEFIHARGISDEKETQLLTIKGLKAMDKIYPEVVAEESSWKNWFSSEHDPDIINDEGHNPQIIRDSLNYAIQSRKSFDVSITDIKQKLKS